jgi:putative addiction module component (TIGR02574 family)
MTTQEIVEHIRALPPEERADLVDQLIVECSSVTFDPSVSDEWTAEIRRRVDAIRSGKVTCRPVDEVCNEIEQTLHRA